MDYEVVNETRGRLLANHARDASTFWERFLGLMGKRELPMGHALHLSPCTGIHTFFMRIPIDAVLLDRDLHVMKLWPDLPPWRLTTVHRAAQSVLELPAGVLAASGTQVGDRLRFNSSGRRTEEKAGARLRGF